MKRAIYAGSFDVFTHGHMWVINTACDLFDEVVIVVAKNPEKKYLLTEDERVSCIQKAFDGEEPPNIVITSREAEFIGDTAESFKARFLIRGLRGPADFEMERMVQNINLDLYPKLQTVFLAPPKYLVDISSSMVKSLIGFMGWEQKIGRYVPYSTQDLLVKKFSRK